MREYFNFARCKKFTGLDGRFDKIDFARKLVKDDEFGKKVYELYLTKNDLISYEDFEKKCGSATSTFLFELYDLVYAFCVEKMEKYNYGKSTYLSFLREKKDYEIMRRMVQDCDFAIWIIEFVKDKVDLV